MSAERRTLIIRADASAVIGTGHVMRCLALAQAWQDAGGQVTFAMTLDAPAVQQRLESEGMRVVRLETDIGSADDAAHTIRLARETNAHWVILDGYQFTAETQHAIKQAGFTLLWMDDNGDAAHYYADIVLNQNLHADASLYAQREPYTELLLGTRYVLLRREFRNWREWRREIPAVARKVLVTLGGGDADNVTLKVIEALQHVAVDDLEAVVVIGASNPHVAELAAAARASRIPIRLETNAPNMPELMAWADVAIAGAGSTCWELAFMGLPSIVLVLTENQKESARLLAEQGISICFDGRTNLQLEMLTKTCTRLIRDREIRQSMSQKGKRLLDGNGVERARNSMADKGGL